MNYFILVDFLSLFPGRNLLSSMQYDVICWLLGVAVKTK